MSKKANELWRIVKRMSMNESLDLKCKYCNSRNVIRFGVQKNKQQYFCKNCERKFNLNDTLTMMKTPVPVIASALSQYYN